MIVKRDFIYTPKGTSRPLHIYLPNNYYFTRDHYPVMYFFDGHNLFFNEDATYGKSWGLKDFLDSWGKEIIIVGIECGHDGQERLSEYLPYPAIKSSSFSQFYPMGDVTMQWILNEVKPVIDRDFRTIPFRECTGIGGSSMGGLMALYAAIRYNSYFSKAACVSSAIGFCIRPLLKDLRSTALSPDTRLFLSWGTNEAHGIKDPSREDRSSRTYSWNRQVYDLATGKNASARLFCQVEGYHCEADWEKQVPHFMNYLWTS